MKKSFSIPFAFFLIIAVYVSYVPCLRAQTTDSSNTKNINVLNEGTNIYSFTGNITWETYYLPTTRGLIKESQTQLYAEFRNIEMLNAHFGLGYTFFTAIYFEGFLDGVGLGGAGAGALARYYPFENTRLLPYIQAGIAGGYNMASSGAVSINDVDSFRFSINLRLGLEYRISEAFGLFFEIGPSWGYNYAFQLKSRSLQFQMGIALYLN